jgi:hypothetical protein
MTGARRRSNRTPGFAGLFRSAPGRIRTCGLLLRRQALYPLSYGRECRRDGCSNLPAAVT